MNAPAGVAIDATGNIYIADTGNNRIRKIDVAGVITTVAGSGPAGSSGDGGQAKLALLNGPLDIAVDSAGNLYIADEANSRIRKVDVTGVITTIAGNGYGRVLRRRRRKPPRRRSTSRGQWRSTAPATCTSPTRGISAFEGSAPTA